MGIVGVALWPHGVAAQGPYVTSLQSVREDVLALRIAVRTLEPGRQEPYVRHAGDELRRQAGQRWVYRDGHVLGSLVGPGDRTLYRLDRLAGADLDVAPLANVDFFTLRGPAGVAQRPTRVARKTRPTAMARLGSWDWDFPLEHTLYLQFSSPLRPGASYRLSFGDARLKPQTWTYDPSGSPSEAVHVSQVGFRPDDPVKLATLSCWMGDGGGLTYEPNRPFDVRDEATGRIVWHGRLRLAKAGADASEDPYRRNYNGTDVYEADFSRLDRPGRYRVHVPGVGCSDPFPIAADVWTRAVTVAARGFYHQRSGIALGPPYTDFRRPRCFHPDDGLVVYASTCPLMDSGNGLNARGTDTDNFGNLVAGRTDTVVPQAWGGYFDAGDWDRRIQHLEATRLQLELLDLFPAYFGRLALNIPESDNALPDLLDEALWNLDCYRRMQTAEGGIRGGIESAGHPRTGECSWQEQLTVMAYAPGSWSSYVYAGVAARAAGVLRPLAPDRARLYEDSARRAMAFAERAYAAREAQSSPYALRDARNLAAAELYRLTGEARWHHLFLTTTRLTHAGVPLAKYRSHDQRDAAFVYLRTLAPTETEIRRNLRQALLAEADTSATWGLRTAFGWTKKDPWIPVGWGLLATPQVVDVLRAHALTGQGRYLACALRACRFGTGDNPNNLCYTTGLGQRWPQHPLWLDARYRGSPPPPGLTVYGPMDTQRNRDDWAAKLLAPALHPSYPDWPTTEAYFDVYLFPAVTEFTVMQTLGPTTYVWGYLAARPRADGNLRKE